MSLREALNNNGIYATVGAIVLLCLALGVVVWRQASQGRPAFDAVYYYDLGSDELFLDEPGRFPPIDAPSGQPGVRAHVFACGPCPPRDELLGKSWQQIEASTNAHVGYFERYTDEAREVLLGRGSGDEAGDYPIVLEGRRFRLPDQQRWVSAHSSAGRRMEEQAVMRCPGDETARPCHP